MRGRSSLAHIHIYIYVYIYISGFEANTFYRDQQALAVNNDMLLLYPPNLRNRDHLESTMLSVCPFS